MQAIIAQASEWGQYGPAGLIISAILAALAYIYKASEQRQRELDERHTKEREAMRKECTEERCEILTLHREAWEESRADLKETHANLSRVVENLTTAVTAVHTEVRAQRLATDDRNRGNGNGPKPA